MELINKKTTEQGYVVNTYFDSRITDYVTRVRLQREDWIANFHGSDEDRYKAEQAGGIKNIEHVMAVKKAVDNLKEVDSTDLVRELLFSDNYHDYLTNWFKGRGGYEAHSMSILQMSTAVAQEVGKLTGYEIEWSGPAWVLRKIK